MNLPITPSINDSKRSAICAQLTICLPTFVLLALFLTTPALALQGKLNINTATAKELQQLPFIGETKAQEIIKLRQQDQIHDLSEVQNSSAIGPSTYQAILPYIKLSGPHTLSGLPTTLTDNDSIQAKSLIITRPGEIKFLTDGEYYGTLIHLIRTARKQINITMYLFKTTQAKTNLPRKIIDELSAALKRNVKIQIVLEKSGHDKGLNKENQRTANLLKRRGIHVAFDNKETTTHAKLAVFDQHLCLLGSHNLTHSALERNHETSLLVDSTELAKQILAYMEKLPE